MVGFVQMMIAVLRGAGLSAMQTGYPVERNAPPPRMSTATPISGRLFARGRSHAAPHGCSTYARWAARARSYSARAARTGASSETAATGTSHQPP